MTEPTPMTKAPSADDPTPAGDPMPTGDGTPMTAPAAVARDAHASTPTGDPASPSRDPAPPAASAPQSMLFLGGLVVLAIGALVAGMSLGGRSAAPSQDAPPVAAGDSGGAATGGMPASSGGEPAGGLGPPVSGAGSAAGDTGGVSTGLVVEGRASLGEPAPPFTLETPDGGMLSLSDFAGRPIVLNFWATWCRPCAVEMPYLQMAHAKYGNSATYGDAALAVIAVDVGEMTSVVKPWLEERGLTFPVALDLNSAVANQYRVFAYPTTYLIDRDGRVINIRRGAFANQFDLDQGIGLIMPEMKE